MKSKKISSRVALVFRMLIDRTLYVLLGFLLFFLFLKKTDSFTEFKEQVDHRKNFYTQYYQLDIPGGGLWCSPVKTRVSGAGVFLVHTSPKDNSRRLLVIVERRYGQGVETYLAGVPAGFFDGEHVNQHISANVVLASESLLYESHLKQAPLSVSEAYEATRKYFSKNNIKPIPYTPDTNLIDTVFRETLEEAGFDLRPYYEEKLIQNWTIAGVDETKDKISVFYYGELHLDDVPVLYPKDKDVKIAAWIPVSDISIANRTIIVDNEVYPLSPEIPVSTYDFIVSRILTH